MTIDNVHLLNVLITKFYHVDMILLKDDKQ